MNVTLWRPRDPQTTAATAATSTSTSTTITRIKTSTHMMRTKHVHDRFNHLPILHFKFLRVEQTLESFIRAFNQSFSFFGSHPRRVERIIWMEKNFMSSGREWSGHHLYFSKLNEQSEQNERERSGAQVAFELILPLYIRCSGSFVQIFNYSLFAFLTLFYWPHCCLFLLFFLHPNANFSNNRMQINKRNKSKLQTKCNNTKKITKQYLYGILKFK